MFYQFVFDAWNKLQNLPFYIAKASWSRNFFSFFLHRITNEIQISFFLFFFESFLLAHSQSNRYIAILLFPNGVECAGNPTWLIRPKRKTFEHEISSIENANVAWTSKRYNSKINRSALECSCYITQGKFGLVFRELVGHFQRRVNVIVAYDLKTWDSFLDRSSGENFGQNMFFFIRCFLVALQRNVRLKSTVV